MNIDIGPMSNNMLSLDEAWLYCACLYHGGYSDWRMIDYNEVAQVTALNDIELPVLWHLSDLKLSRATRAGVKWRIIPVRDL